MPRFNRSRLNVALPACAVAFTGVLAMSSAAGAATIHACVKKTSGATRIVSAKAKCKHGEQSLSWNTTGPKGSTGAQGTAGANGANGANGAVAGFAAGSTATTPIEETGTVLLSKLLPPGSYVLSAKAVVDAASKTSTDLVIVECALFDGAGTTPPTGGTPLDGTVWGSPLTKFFSSKYEAVANLPFAGSVSSSVASTVDVDCAGKAEELKALSVHLTAIQVSSLG